MESTARMIQAFTIRTSRAGEIVSNDIILNGGCIMVNHDRFPMTKDIFGNIITEVRTRNDTQETILTSIPLDGRPALYSTDSIMDWYEHREDGFQIYESH